MAKGETILGRFFRWLPSFSSSFRKLVAFVGIGVIMSMYGVWIWGTYPAAHHFSPASRPSSNPIEQENFPISKEAAAIYKVEIGFNLSTPTRFVPQPMDSPDILKLDQLDPRLWEHVKTNHIFPPSTLPYPFKKESVSGLIDPKVDKIHFEMFKNKTGGIFVEVGGYDGMYSHTLMYEVTRNWTGLLIECHPQLLPLLKRAHRKVYVADVCLSTENHPGKGQLTAQDNHAGSSAMGPGPKFYPKTASNFSVYDVQTVPLYAILAAVGIREIDLFILDIQALELPVLKLFPFDRVLVRVWVVEVAIIHAKQKAAIRRLMEKNGYSKELFWDRGSDYIFVHESFKPSVQVQR